jgi:hypothetical protein
MELILENYPRVDVEWAMKVEEVLLRASSGKTMWWHTVRSSGSSANYRLNLSIMPRLITDGEIHKQLLTVGHL